MPDPSEVGKEFFLVEAFFLDFAKKARTWDGIREAKDDELGSVFGCGAVW